MYLEKRGKRKREFYCVQMKVDSAMFGTSERVMKRKRRRRKRKKKKEMETENRCGEEKERKRKGDVFLRPCGAQGFLVVPARAPNFEWTAFG